MGRGAKGIPSNRRKGRERERKESKGGSRGRGSGRGVGEGEEPGGRRKKMQVNEQTGA